MECSLRYGNESFHPFYPKWPFIKFQLKHCWGLFADALADDLATQDDNNKKCQGLQIEKSIPFFIFN